MDIDGFIWLEDIVEKLWKKHHVEKHEVEEVLDNSPFFRYVQKGHREEEDVYAALGQTNSGRYLIVFFVYKKNNRVIVVSARNMTAVERRQYDRR